jgi:homocysteine S-methyltransferase
MHLIFLCIIIIFSMDINYFKKIRVLDGGMGQELLSKGLRPRGTLWSATALIDKKYHKLVVDTHLNFIKSGADVIVTNNFSARRTRTVQNNVDKYFNYANEKAGELALKAKKISNKNILIAGSLPAQNDTYLPDERDERLIKKNFSDQADLLKPFIDFFYLDVLSSIREIKIALSVAEKINLPVLVGLHIRENGKLTSGETIASVFEKCKNKNWLGLITACTSPEITENVLDEIKGLKIPFGFKANLWKKQPLPVAEIVTFDKDGFGANPVNILGSRNDITSEKFYDFSRKMISKGATILGGCCETKPSHIKAISKLKQI